MSKQSPARYRTTNWSSDTDSLMKRGSLLIWLDKYMTWLAPHDGCPGLTAVFSDAAIQFCLTIKVLFKLPLRQTTGMVASPLNLLVDSPRIKILGDGEWQARKHGVQGRRQWRKVNLGHGHSHFRYPGSGIHPQQRWRQFCAAGTACPDPLTPPYSPKSLETAGVRLKAL